MLRLLKKGQSVCMPQLYKCSARTFSRQVCYYYPSRVSRWWQKSRRSVHLIVGQANDAGSDLVVLLRMLIVEDPVEQRLRELRRSLQQ